LGELAAGIAHEINQPIQNILLSAESIQLELQEDSVNKDFINYSLTDIYEDVARTREIIDHIRIFSSGQKEGVFERFSVDECVSKALAMISYPLKKVQINVEVIHTKKELEVMGNPHKVEQVLINLLSNAKDAIEERKLKEPDLKKKIEIKTDEYENEVIIEVRDNGIGIPYAKKTNVFLPFYTTKLLGKGTGLGLSISYSIIKEMNGRIEVQSRVMEGTVMKIILPKTPNLQS
jgi:C4-dicarboxylate-specific signal transduction histidine kinase